MFECFCFRLLGSNCKQLCRINGCCTLCSTKLCCKLTSKKCFHSQIWIYSYLFTKYTHTYGTSPAFTSSNWPTFAYTTAASCPATSSTSTCGAAVTSPATVASLPTVSSCYAGSALTASTLTTQAQTPCTSSYFCQVRA